MKNLALSTLFIILSSIFISCSDDEIEVIESDSSIEDKKKFESFRKEFVSIYSESTENINKDIEEYKLSSNSSFKGTEKKLTFDEFLKVVPDSEMHSDQAIILLESAFNNRAATNAKNNSDSAFGANEMYSLAVLFDSWEEDNLTKEDAMNKLLYVDGLGKDFLNKSDCKFFCKVWNGIKAAVKWVWDNYEQIASLGGLALAIIAL